MEFCDELWNEIKKYMFQKYLWNEPENKKYLSVLRKLPRVGFDCGWSPLISKITKPNFVIIRVFDIINWNGGSLVDLSYVYVEDTGPYSAVSRVEYNLVNRLPIDFSFC